MARIDIAALLKHVGCGSVDEIGACVLCDQIRARLRATQATERLYHEILCPTLTQAGPCNCTPVLVADAPAHGTGEPQAPAAVDPVGGIGTEGPRAQNLELELRDLKICLLAVEREREEASPYPGLSWRELLTHTQQERDRAVDRAEAAERERDEALATLALLYGGRG